MKGATFPKPVPMPDPSQVSRAIKLSYAQAMLTAIFVASTGGMFLVGFAIDLGADNILLGAMAGIPQFFVVFQFVAAWLVERGVSRKRITTIFSFVSPLSWFLVAIIVVFAGVMETGERLAVLIGIIALVTLSGHLASNARAGWIGDLIPAGRRGRFFGYCTLFAGVVGSVFAIVEGRFLDIIRSYGLFAFMGLFFFGAVFGIASAALNIPQPECPLPGEGKKAGFWELVRETLRNRPFALLALVHAVIAMSGIAGPFGAAYCLRDVGLSFFGLGILNSVAMIAMLVSSPFWGRLVDKIGCRPVLILGLLMMAPCSGFWFFIPPNSPRLAYLLLPWSNFITGLGSAAIGIAITSMMYKLSRPEGRSIQFAVYSVFVAMVGAPMPVLGGWLVSHLQSAGYAIDLRITFYFWSAFIFFGAFLAAFLHEPEVIRTRTLVFTYIPNQLARFWGYVASISPLLFFASQDRKGRRKE